MSTDHFKVCRALKEIAKLPQAEPETIVKVVECLTCGIMAVEKNAICSLRAHTSLCMVVLPTLISITDRRVEDAGCHFSCCGFSAFHGPIKQYTNLILTILGEPKPDEVMNLIRQHHPRLENEDIFLEIFG